jgi:type IV pilus assembly protein PilM
MSLAARAAAIFRPRSSRHQIGPIGIDFSLESVHLVQLESIGGQPPQVRACVSMPLNCTRRELLSKPLLFRTLIRQALAKGNFYRRQVVIAIPSGLFRTMSVNFKSAQGKNNETAAIIKIMRERLDGDISDYVLDYLPVLSRSKNDERLALVAVSERKAVVDLLELARKSGLETQALEIGPIAISRLVGALSADRGSKNVLVINSGRRASYLTLISGTDLLFDQEVAFGENSLIEHAAATLDMSQDMVRDLVLRAGVQSGHEQDSVSAVIEESGLVGTLSEILKPKFMKLVEEIKRVCLYAAAETRGGAVSQIYLLGSIARWPGSEQMLSSLMDSNVEKIPDPLALFPAGDEPRNDEASVAPEIVVATGLALRGMQTHG